MWAEKSIQVEDPVEPILQDCGNSQKPTIGCIHNHKDSPEPMPKSWRVILAFALTCAFFAIGSLTAFRFASAIGVLCAMFSVSELFGFSKAMARTAKPAAWAKLLNFVRECLANEPKERAA